MNHRVRITHSIPALILLFLLSASPAFAATAIYRSVGPSATTALVTGTSPSITLSISGTAATFSLAIADNIGVGDAIQYDSDNNGSIDAVCFIHGRTDARNYAVKNVTGGTPTATSAADNDWAIFRAYTSLNDACFGTENVSLDDTIEDFDAWSWGRNLVTNDEQWNIACYANGTTGDNTIVSISGDDWTTDATRYLRIYTPYATSEVGVSQRHNGTWDDGKYKLDPNLASAGFDLGSSEGYVRLEGLQFYIQGSGYYIGGIAIDTPTASMEWRISQCIFRGVTSGMGKSQNVGIEFWTDYNGVVKAWNNIFYHFRGGAGREAGIWLSKNTGTIYAYNNTFYDSTIGLCKDVPGTFIAKNNLFKNVDTPAGGEHADEFDVGTDYNATDKSAMGYTVTGGGNIHDRLSQAITFIDEMGADFHLESYDTGGKDYGVSDPGSGLFSDDIDRVTRGGNWDIGADETVTAIYRSVGVGATNPLASGGSNALSISGSTATFASDLPDNVGVGDALQYDSDNGGTIDSICFIHARADAKHYTVRAASGATPTATTAADNDWALYRAYTSLYNAEYANENDSINDTVENFESWAGGRDMVTNNEQWNIACYENGSATDDTAVDIDTPWSGSAANYLRIYTPVSTNEVGTSQRHKGYWGTGYRRTGYLIIRVGYVYVDGLSIRQSNSDRIYFVYGNTVSGEVRISNCFGQNTYNSSLDVYDIYSVGATVFKVWNNIGINDSTNTSAEAFFLNDADVTGYFYNNTGIANAGRAFRQSAGTGTLKNNIGISATGAAFSGTWASADYNASDDATADDWGGTGNKINQVFSFVDQDNDNFHLAVNDTAAMDSGANLSADGNLSFANDIDGQARTGVGAWDIGADEYALVARFKTNTKFNRNVKLK